MVDERGENNTSVDKMKQLLIQYELRFANDSRKIAELEAKCNKYEGKIVELNRTSILLKEKAKNVLMLSQKCSYVSVIHHNDSLGGSTQDQSKMDHNLVNLKMKLAK